MLYHHGREILHMFSSLAETIAGHGRCLKCLSEHSLPAARPDLAVGGLPCQALTPQRWKSGGTPRTGSALTHPDYQTVLRWEDYLKSRRPKGFITEEVPTFMHKCPGVDSTHLRDGHTDVQRVGLLRGDLPLGCRHLVRDGSSEDPGIS